MMEWGFFSTAHMVSLAAALALIAALYLVLRGRTRRVQTLVLGVLSFSGIAAIVFNLLAWHSPYEYLPLHLCSITALALPAAVFTRSRRLNNLLLLWALGALMALVINSAQANYRILSWTFAFYYIPHTLQLGIPVLMFALGLVRMDPRCIGSTLGITFGVYTLVHLINCALNTHLLRNGITNPSGSVVQVNYMYSIQPENPVLELFYQIIPHPYWYMFLALPIILVYLLVVYLPVIRRGKAYPGHDA